MRRVGISHIIGDGGGMGSRRDAFVVPGQGDLNSEFTECLKAAFE